jgi:hypothetical protein
MNPTRAGSLIGALLIVVLFCVGFGWMPGDIADHQERLALLGLAAAGLVWSASVLWFAARQRGVESAEVYEVAPTGARSPESPEPARPQIG